MSKVFPLPLYAYRGVFISENKLLVKSTFDDQNHFHEMGEDGIIRVFELASGKVVAILGSQDQLSTIPQEFVEITREDGTKVLVQKNVSLDEHALGMKTTPYSKALCDVICQRVANGENLIAILNESGMPTYSQLKRWARQNPDFDLAMEHAHRDAADYLADRAMVVAEEAYENHVGQAQMARVSHLTDVIKWRAQVNNPKKYSPTNKIQADINMPVQIIVNTGIRRPGDAGYLVDETQKIKDAIEMKVTDATKPKD